MSDEVSAVSSENGHLRLIDNCPGHQCPERPRIRDRECALAHVINRQPFAAREQGDLP